MRYKNKPLTIDAEQFFPDKPLPFNKKGPYVAMDGHGYYVVTAHAKSVYLETGDFVVLEPSGPLTPSFAAYPVKPDIFHAEV